tara:strand:- start:389 stop:631 length:243 start_codon:yes stop_codon:yes gene_type:complete
MNPENLKHYVKVYLKISNTIHPVDDRYHIKWEENIVKEVSQREVVFHSTDFTTAINKIAYMQSVHKEGYFTTFSIESGKP